MTRDINLNGVKNLCGHWKSWSLSKINRELIRNHEDNIENVNIKKWNFAIEQSFLDYFKSSGLKFLTSYLGIKFGEGNWKFVDKYSHHPHYYKIVSLDKSVPSPPLPEEKMIFFRGRVRLHVSYNAGHFKTLIRRERLRDEQEWKTLVQSAQKLPFFIANMQICVVLLSCRRRCVSL